jgi:hypothetical protein
MEAAQMTNKKTHTLIILLCIIMLLCVLVCACQNKNEEPSKEDSALPDRDATPQVLAPVASGTKTFEDALYRIDVSNGNEGYVMVEYRGSNERPLFRITFGDAQYVYYIQADEYNRYVTFPLSEGSGEYTLQLFEHKEGDRYTSIFAENISVTIENELLPFLYPNQYVDFSGDSVTVAKGSEVVTGVKSDLGAVEAIYHYVSTEISYDYEKADAILAKAIVGYLPDVDEILEIKTGICFDYAAVMATMLRSQGIPTRLVTGNSGNTYHAWLNVYIEDIGWIDGIIYFDGTDWVLMDPTYASTYDSDKALEKYMGDGSNYNAMFFIKDTSRNLFGGRENGKTNKRSVTKRTCRLFWSIVFYCACWYFPRRGAFHDGRRGR